MRRLVASCAPQPIPALCLEAIARATGAFKNALSTAAGVGLVQRALSPGLRVMCWYVKDPMWFMAAPFNVITTDRSIFL